jgi:hypothetical protein
MKNIFIVISLLVFSLTKVHAASYECFEVTMNPSIANEATRVSDGIKLELKFKANKVKLTYIESGDRSRFIGQIITNGELDQGLEYMGAIDSEMYTLQIKQSPPLYFESTTKIAHILATFYSHGSSGIPMFCNFFKETYRFN